MCFVFKLSADFISRIPFKCTQHCPTFPLPLANSCCSKPFCVSISSSFKATSSRAVLVSNSLSATLRWICETCLEYWLELIHCTCTGLEFGHYLAIYFNMWNQWLPALTSSSRNCSFSPCSRWALSIKFLLAVSNTCNSLIRSSRFIACQKKCEICYKSESFELRCFKKWNYGTVNLDHSHK